MKRTKKPAGKSAAVTIRTDASGAALAQWACLMAHATDLRRRLWADDAAPLREQVGDSVTLLDERLCDLIDGLSNVCPAPPAALTIAEGRGHA